MSKICFDAFLYFLHMKPNNRLIYRITNQQSLLHVNTSLIKEKFRLHQYPPPNPIPSAVISILLYTPSSTPPQNFSPPTHVLPPQFTDPGEREQQVPAPAPPPLNEESEVTLELEKKELWQSFCKHGTEMVITKAGRLVLFWRFL